MDDDVADDAGLRTRMGVDAVQSGHSDERVLACFLVHLELAGQGGADVGDVLALLNSSVDQQQCHVKLPIRPTKCTTSRSTG